MTGWDVDGNGLVVKRVRGHTIGFITMGICSSEWWPNYVRNRRNGRWCPYERHKHKLRARRILDPELYKLLEEQDYRQADRVTHPESEEDE